MFFKSKIITWIKNMRLQKIICGEYDDFAQEKFYYVKRRR